eukprot:1216332-Prorocentrum_lima.AAC.1
MTSSLVGSEMCIRDSALCVAQLFPVVRFFAPMSLSPWKFAFGLPAFGFPPPPGQSLNARSSSKLPGKM